MVHMTQTLAQAMANRQEWEHATADPRSLAIAADAELRRRHPHQKIEPLRSGEPVAVSDTGREQLSPGPDDKLTERLTRIRDLAAQRQASRAEMDEHPGRMVPGEDPVWGELGDAFPDSRTFGPDAILQPPRPEIIPSARLLHLAAERDTEPDREVRLREAAELMRICRGEGKGPPPAGGRRRPFALVTRCQGALENE